MKVPRGAAAAHHERGEHKVQLVQAPVGPRRHVAHHRRAHADDLRRRGWRPGQDQRARAAKDVCANMQTWRPLRSLAGGGVACSRCTRRAARPSTGGMLAQSRACKAGPAAVCSGALEGRRLLDEDFVREGWVGRDAVLPPPPPHQEIPAAAAPVRPALASSCRDAFQPRAVRAAWHFIERRPCFATAVADVRGRLCRPAAGLVGPGAGVTGTLAESVRRESG